MQIREGVSLLTSTTLFVIELEIVFQQCALSLVTSRTRHLTMQLFPAKISERVTLQNL